MLVSVSTSAQRTFFSDSILVQSKIWSRDSMRKIQYSDWKTFPSHTVEMLKGFQPTKKLLLSKYGGDATKKKWLLAFSEQKK